MVSLKRDIKKELYEKLMQNGNLHMLPVVFQSNDLAEKLDWKFYDPNTISFYTNYLRSDDFLRDLKNSPTIVDSLPVGFYTENELWVIIEKNVYSLLSIHDGEVTKEMYIYGINKDPLLFAFLSDRHQTIDIVQRVLEFEPLLLEFVKDEFRYYWICTKAVAKNWQSLAFVPTDIIDEDLIELALAQKDSYLLDIIPTNLINAEIYSRFFESHPKESVDTLMRYLLNPEDADSLIEVIEGSDQFTAEVMLGTCDPKILIEDERQLALIMLLNHNINWVHYIQNGCMSNVVFEFCLQNNEFPTLSALEWSSSKIQIAFNTQKRAFTRLPFEKIDDISYERISEIISTAIEEDWLDELPHFFFRQDVIENKVFHPILVQQRQEYRLSISRANNFSFGGIENLSFSISELKRIKSRTSDTDLAMVDLHIENFVLLNDEAKNFDLSKKFVTKYPSHYEELPELILSDKELMRQLLLDIPSLNRYVPTDKISEIFK